MPLSEQPWLPTTPKKRQVDSAYDAVAKNVRKELRRIAIDEDDEIIARKTRGDHVGIYVEWDVSVEGMPLMLTLYYNLRLREKFRPDPKIIDREDTFSRAQTARIVNTIPNKPRRIIADLVVLEVVDYARMIGECIEELDRQLPMNHRSRQKSGKTTPNNYDVQLKSIYEDMRNGTISHTAKRLDLLQ